jgi:hypothetical protein
MYRLCTLVKATFLINDSNAHKTFLIETCISSPTYNNFN